MRLADAPHNVRSFGMACWGELPNYLDGLYLSFWRFLEMAVYNADDRTITFGGITWHVPSEESTDD